MAHPNKIRLLIADPQEVARQGLKSLLAGTEVKVVAEAATAQRAVECALRSEVDLVLMELRMPDGDAVSALGHIKLEKPTLPVLLFSAFDGPADIARAAALGANGYVSKGCQAEELIANIREVAAGRNTWTREQLRRVSAAMAVPRLNMSMEVSLTKREGDILKEMVSGATNKEIAETLHISYETVKEHTANVIRKIGVADRTQAALWAVRNKLA